METILITGANRGIGLQLCKEFSAAGWSVLAACRNPDAASELAALSAAATLAGKQMRVLPLDVTSASSVAALAAALKSDTIDVLINNAGIMGGEHQSLNDMDYAAWLQTLEVNTIAPLRVSSAVLPNLRRSQHPRIITISSQMGAFGLSMEHTPYAYCTSKTAVSKVMQILAQDLKADGVIVCPVHPGWVQTDMGGPGAHITPAQSAQGLLKLITTLTPEHSGRFWTWEGKEHVW